MLLHGIVRVCCSLCSHAPFTSDYIVTFKQGLTVSGSPIAARFGASGGCMYTPVAFAVVCFAALIVAPSLLMCVLQP